MSEIKAKIKELEECMARADFWSNKEKAQETIREYQEAKDAMAGVGKYDKGDAIMSIFAGAGGDDAEDFARMLYLMYLKFIENKGWSYYVLYEHRTDESGYRSVTLEISGKDAYGELKNESGVHRLVRISPFNANKKRHTSFCLVEVVPKFKKAPPVEISEDDIKIEFSKSGGAGGQNVNKRETAVRIVHIPTNISVHVSSERSQLQNREKALAILRGKIYHRQEEERKKKEKQISMTSGVSAEWGNQIRSYVLHPYKMIKDHRTGVETSSVDSVLGAGELDKFINAEKNL